ASIHIFFYSSRRRHTRSKRDWSSDVCSSDLYINSTGIALIVGILARARKERRAIVACSLSAHYQEIFEITRLSDFMRMFPDEERSEERRVGKECGWW